MNWVIWIIWALIGLLGGLYAGMFFGRKRLKATDAIVGTAAAVAGGFLTAHYLGSSPMQLYLVSVLGAVFFAAASLWIIGVIAYKK